MIAKITKYIHRLIAPKSPLKRELYYLNIAIKKQSKKIDYIYDLSYGSCCPLCAYPELYDLEDKLDRQVNRQKMLMKKLGKIK